MVESERRSKPRKILGIITVLFGVLALVVMSSSLGSCWNAPLERAGIGAPYDLAFRVLGTFALVPFFLFAILYIIVGWRQGARASTSYLSLFVGALSSFFAGLLLWWASLFEERKIPIDTQKIIVGLVVAFGIHAIWTLMCWRSEGRSRERRRALRWVGLALICLGGIAELIRSFNARTPDVTLEHYRARIGASSISVDGQQVATVDAKGNLVLWDVATGRARWSNARHLASLSGEVAFSVDGRRLLSEGPDGVKVFDALTGRILHSLPAGRILDLAPERPLIVLEGADVCVWNIEDGRREYCAPCERPKQVFFMSDDSIYAVCRERSIRAIWDLGIGRLEEVADLPSSRLWLSPGDDRVFAHELIPQAATRISVWRSGIRVGQVDIRQFTNSIVGRSFDGRLALGVTNYSSVDDPSIRVFLVDLATGETQALFGGAAVASFMLARGGEYAVTTSLDTTAGKNQHAVRVWSSEELAKSGAP